MTFPDECSSVPSLLAVSVDAIVDSPKLLSNTWTKSPQNPCSSTADIPSLPLETSRIVFNVFRKAWSAVPIATVDSQQILEYFTDGDRLPLDEMDLSKAILNDDLLRRLVQAHQNRLISLDLTDVVGLADFQDLTQIDDIKLEKLTSLAFSSYELLGPSNSRLENVPKHLSIGTLPILSEFDLDDSDIITPQVQLDDHMSTISSRCNSQLTLNLHYSPFTCRCPLTESLTLLGANYHENERPENSNDFVLNVLTPLKQLRRLDLSYWQKMEDLRCLRPFSGALTALVLYDVPDLYHALDTICQLGTIRHLDISQSQRDTGTYPKPVTALHKLVISLRQLQYLDISSTNLASQPSDADRPFKGWELERIANASVACLHALCIVVPHCDAALFPFSMGTLRSDVFGLRCLRKRLRFLGLFNCDHASHFAEIPAEQITGDANESQIMLSLEVYRKRVGLLQKVLNEVYQLYRFGNDQRRQKQALDFVVDSMSLHLADGTLQIAGSASIFYIIKQIDMSGVTKRAVLTVLLNGMDAHMDEQVMIRNCCLTLCQFEIPHEILFDYGRVARLMIVILQRHNGDILTQRIVVFILNSMACHVEGEQKVQVGNLGAIEVILEQIRRKHSANICDEVMEVGWSFLWNITDETPLNCERFLRANGLELFYECYQSYPGKWKLQRNMMGLMQFPGETELVRNMMGLIGNIAEVHELRVQLMKSEYISIYCELLTNLTDGIEISYNSAGVLAHMVSNGQEAWDLAGLAMSRDDVMNQMIAATCGWNILARRFINYRSFRPILRLLPMTDSPGSQHWAVWALANLTSTDKPKYCPYIVNEGGEPLLEQIILDANSSAEIKRLVEIVLANLAKWRTKEAELEEMPEIVDE